MAVHLETLGTIRVSRDGVEQDRLPSQPVRCALLVYMALEREAGRDTVLALLWPDKDADHARRALNQTVYELRQLLGDDCVGVSGDRLHAGDEVTADLLEFRDRIEAGEAEQALALYGGAFLGGAGLASTRAFEGWVDAWQAKLERLHRQARREAIDARLAAGDDREALGLAREWVELDPLDDEAQHRLIELLAASGDRSGALRQYDRYEALVRRELELEPLDETKELVERIRTGDVAAPTGPAEAGEEPADQVREPAPAYLPASGPAPTTAREPADYAVLSFREELRQRKVLPWTAGYLAAALGTIEGVDILFEWPEWLQPRLWALVFLGLFIVLVAAWNHGKAGLQEVTGPELAAQGLLAVAFAMVILWPTERETPQPSWPLTDIAVLYLDDFFPPDEMPGLADQLTEALITELDWSQGVEVRPRAAVAPYRDGETPLDSVAAALRVGAIVEGSVHDVEGDIRLTIQLFEADSHRHLLTDTLRMASDSRARILESLPRDAARRILRRLGEEVRQRQARSRTDSEAAWELYARAVRIGEYEQDIWGATVALNRADSLLAEAERLDPDWPDPTLRRARFWQERARLEAAPGENYEPAATRTAIAHLDRALEERPNFAPALASRGALLVELAENQPHPDSAEALRGAAELDLIAATEADPNNALAWSRLADLLHRWKRYTAEFRAAERALEADVFLEHEASLLFWYGFAAHNTGRHHTEARDACRRGRELYPGITEYPLCLLYIFSADPTLEPDPDYVWALRDTLMAVGSIGYRPVWGNLGRIWAAKTLARAGLADSARAVLRPFLDEAAPFYTRYDHAHARVLLGDHDLALDLLEAYTEARPATASTLVTDWYYRPLWDNPRFRQLAGDSVQPEP